MKWKNIDVGPAYYYITGTITEWLPLLARPSIRNSVCADIIIALKACGGSMAALRVLAAHANGGCRYAAWKEQVRGLAIWSKYQAGVKINYIHANPVRRGLVTHPADWQHSSYRFYELGEEVDLPITPIEP